MKDYYQILGVRRGASLPEIRRAYRMLVQKLHPDVNADPAAHELIKDVNEAYDVLGDEAKKKDYDYKLENPYASVFVSEEPKHRDPAYKRKQPYVHVNRRDSIYDLMNQYVHIADKTFWSGFVLCLILVLDLALPHRMTSDSISSFSYEGRGRYTANYIITERGERIKVGQTNIFETGQPIEIVKSRVLSILVEIRFPKGGSFSNLSTIFANFRFVLWILIIFSSVGLLFRKKGSVDFRFNLGILTFFVLMFVIYLLIK